jgi:hypothetical protein
MEITRTAFVEHRSLSGFDLGAQGGRAAGSVLAPGACSCTSCCSCTAAVSVATVRS